MSHAPAVLLVASTLCVLAGRGAYFDGAEAGIMHLPPPEVIAKKILEMEIRIRAGGDAEGLETAIAEMRASAALHRVMGSPSRADDWLTLAVRAQDECEWGLSRRLTVTLIRLLTHASDEMASASALSEYSVAGTHSCNAQQALEPSLAVRLGVASNTPYAHTRNISHLTHTPDTSHCSSVLPHALYNLQYTPTRVRGVLTNTSAHIQTK